MFEKIPEKSFMIVLYLIKIFPLLFKNILPYHYLLKYRAASPVENEYVTQEGRSTFYHGNSDPKYILDTVSTASEEEEIKNNSKE